MKSLISLIIITKWQVILKIGDTVEGDIKIYNSKFKTKINRFTVLSEPGSKNDQDIKLKQDSSILIMDSDISGDIIKKGKKFQ